jgi:N-acetylneuraminic acid mutarotase
VRTGKRCLLSSWLCWSALAVSCAALSASAQTTAPNEWTWVGGSPVVGSDGGQLGVYGTMGTPAPGNNPGRRDSSATWTDSEGNLWLFSGGDYGGFLNDLWEFSPSTTEWTWIGGSGTQTLPGVYGTLGSPSAGSAPGGRLGAATWTDKEGNFWLFGGYGVDSTKTSGCLNDFWRFSPSANQWTWMGGSSNLPNVFQGQPGVYGTLGTPSAANIPGGREYPSSWTDSNGNFWLFGGYGDDSGDNSYYLNDLWEFNPTAGEWTWVSGSSTVAFGNGQPGSYGALGTPASANTPGGRAYAISWADAKGNLWLFGGNGDDSTDQIGYLDDLWEFDATKNEWTWMGGSSSLEGNGGLPGAFQTWMAPASGNYPGGRQSATGWTDNNGNFWLYGGFGADSTGVLGELNDLWELNPSTSQWAWMDGDETIVRRPNGELGRAGVYGVLQAPGFGNNPGGLDSALGWTDKGGNLWLYGGSGFDANGGAGDFNDLWEYQPSAGSETVTATPSFSMSTGSVASGQALTISDSTPGAAIYYFASGAAGPTKYADPIIISSSGTVDAVAVASGHAISAVVSETYSVSVAAAPTFSLAPGTYPTTQTVTLADSTPGATIYYAINGIPTTASNIYTGQITVSSSEIIEAMAVAAGYANSTTVTANYTIWPASALNEWAWIGGLSTGAEAQISGVLGMPAIGNLPGARDQSSSWTDKTGKFWLFGGSSANYDPITQSNGFLNDLWMLDPATNEWAWMAGSTASGCSLSFSAPTGCSLAPPGMYGTVGTPAQENIPGGRQGASTWTDGSGNLWLFGGYGLDANGTSGLTILNDLWKFDIVTHQWAWISGSSTVANNCFEAGSYNCAQPSVFGALGTPAEGNTPGSREDASTWTDSNGNLWLFGGWSFDVAVGVQYYFNELWQFNPSTSLWTWMGGSSTKDGSACLLNENLYYETCGEPGTYGAMTMPSTENIPGGRAGATTWTDSKGNIWMFSGSGFDANGYFGDPNDLWEFSPSTTKWAWMGGNNSIPPCANYDCSGLGTQGALDTPAAGNLPLGRDHASGWTDSKGNFWLYGGGGGQVPNNVTDGGGDDLWEFNPSANEWAWMGNSGNTSTIPDWQYGMLGTPAPGNSPGSRYGASSWTDHSDNFWLFGGKAPFAAPTLYDNDLWEYEPSPPAPVPGFALVDMNDQASYKTDTFTVPAGTSGAITIFTVVSDGFNGAIALSATGLPSGVSASFSPDLITGFGTSQVTYTVGLGVAPGSYTTTLAGTSEGITETTTQSLAVGSPPPAIFMLGASPSSLTVNSGSSGAVTVTVTPEYGFNSAVSFGCSGLPSGTSCSFSPATVTPSGGANASTRLTVSASATAALHRSRGPFFPEAALAVAFFCFGWRKRRRLRILLLLTAMAAGLSLLDACGGGGSSSSGPPPVQPVTSTVTVTATSGALQQTTTFSLTVN